VRLVSEKLKNFIEADWSAPSSIRTLLSQTDTCLDSEKETSQFPLISKAFGFNLASHVGDCLEDVIERRRLLYAHCGFEKVSVGLHQVHGSQCVELTEANAFELEPMEADASFSFESGIPCVISTADCLPILLSDTQGSFVSAIHGGWQGLLKNIIPQTIEKIRARATELDVNLTELCVYLGPAISKKNYQIGSEIFEAFVASNTVFEVCFEVDKSDEAGNGKSGNGKPGTEKELKYLADLKAIATIQLEEAGVQYISDCEICTYEDSHFYSYRKATHDSREQCGRFVSVIWKELELV
jgi:YfiH family protein